jgi:Acyclic terpene utilisation family protein AtuA
VTETSPGGTWLPQQDALRVLSYVCDGRTGARADLSRAIASGLEQGVDVISAQGNGMDNGPYFLGAGDTGGTPTRANFETAITGAKQARIPFVFSLGGRAGADAHLEAYLRVIDEIARGRGAVIRAAVISGQVSKAYLRAKLGQGIRMPRLTPTPRLSEHVTAQDLRDTTVVQAQMGPEPIMAALELYDQGLIDGVLTGRALDTGVHMAYPLLRGFPLAPTAHLAKIIECGSMCCDPPHPFSAVIGEVTRDGQVTVRPALPEYRCTVESVASHALYEREDPYRERMPGGTLDVGGASYRQLDDRSVAAQGAAWHTDPYAVKLEGVRSLGYETALVMAAADPFLVDGIEAFAAAAAKETTEHVVRSGVVDNAESVQIATHIIGKGALPGPGTNGTRPSEIALVIRVLAPTRQASYQVATTMRIRLQMGDFPGRITTAGNFSFPLPKVFLDQGEAFGFSIWHLLPLQDPTEPFPFRITEFPRDMP